MQSKRQSFLEANANTFIGYWINIGVQSIVFPLFGMQVTFAQNILLGLVFLVVSLIRGYAFRRYFNWSHHIKQ